MTLDDLLRGKANPALFKGNLSGRPEFVTDGLLYALTNMGGDQQLLARLARKKFPEENRSLLTHDPDTFLRTMLEPNGQLEVHVGEVSEGQDRAELSANTPKPLGHLDAAKLRLFHAMTGGWDRLVARPGDVAVIAWRGDRPVGAIVRHLSDYDRAVSDARAAASSQGIKDEEAIREAAKLAEERERKLSEAIELGDATIPTSKLRVDPRQRAQALLAMRPEGPFEVTFSIAGREGQRNFLLDASAMPGRRELEVSNLRGVPFPREGRRFEGTRSLSEFLSGAPESSISFDRVYPEAVRALGSLPVPWDIALHILRGNDPVGVHIAGSVVPFATLVFAGGAWHALENATDLLLYKLEVEKNKAEDPPGREERQDLARARGTLWPFPRWKEAIDRAYGGEAPALSFTRLRRDEYGRPSPLRASTSKLVELCTPGTLPSPRSTGRLLIHNRGRRMIEVGRAEKDPSRVIRDYIGGETPRDSSLARRYAPGTLLRLHQTISPPTSGAGSRGDVRTVELGVVEIGVFGHAPAILWHAQGLDLPKRPMSLFSEPEPPRSHEELIAHVESAWAELYGRRRSPSYLWVDELGLVAPRAPHAARSWLMPDRYRSFDNLRIIDGELDAPLLGRAPNSGEFFRSKRSLNFVARFADAIRGRR